MPTSEQTYLEVALEDPEGSWELHRFEETNSIPDVFVLPVSAIGAYDVNAKLPEDRRRGDLETWRLHPFERTLTVWRRQSDGGNIETAYRGDRVQPESPPGVAIDRDLPWR